MDPLYTPMEAVEATAAHRAALADSVVCAAWTSHRDELFAFLVRTTRDPEAAEDLLQDAFLRLTREVRAGREPDNVRAWLYRVSANLAVSRGRRISAGLRGLLRIRSRATDPWSDDMPESRLLRDEARRELLEALNRLAPAARAALLLSSEGFSGAEIAAAIGRTELATRTLMSRSRVLVRRSLETAEAAR